MTIQTDKLAPIEIWEVPLEGSTIKFKQPLVLEPEILDQGTPEECLFLEYPELSLSSVGKNRKELLSGVLSDIRFSWKNYVQKSDFELVVKTRRIKEKYLEFAEEVANG
ncbi:MAG: hypothetical protein ACRC2T_00660 [Thermoguttaceae bacterium]